MSPIPTTRLQSITTSSCTDALSSISSYNHAQAETWNAKIINSILSQLAHASAPLPAAAPSASTGENESAEEREEEKEKPRQRQYKYAVNSTIIQHLDAAPSVPSAGTSTGTGTSTAESLSSPPATPVASALGAAEADGREVGTTPVAGTSSDERTPAPATAPTASAAGVAPEKGRRGMHSATGAYWNNETDGMWSYKWEGGEKHGVDVVISIIWVAV